MTEITCENGTPIDAEEEWGILPSDITTGEYVFLDDCCRYGDEGTYIPVSLTTVLSGIEPGEEVEVTISGGCPPYKWEADLPLSFTSFYTTTTSNTLYLDEGAEPQNSVSTYTIKDVCYVQGSPAANEVGGDTAIAKDGDGNPWAIVFTTITSDCFLDGQVNTISYLPSFPDVTQVSCPNPGISVTGLNPCSVTVPSDYTSPISLVITMLADGYKWADGSDVYGTAVMRVFYCDCDDYENVITYTTQQMTIDTQQTLGVDGTWNNCFEWEITTGGGSLGAPDANGDVVYTAPSTNVNCDSNPTISLKKRGVVTDTLKLAVAAIDGGLAVTKCWACGDYGPYYRRQTYWSCDGSRQSGYGSDVYCSACPGGWYPNDRCSSHWQTCVGLGYPANNTYMDHRSGAMKAAGCCPAQLL